MIPFIHKPVLLKETIENLQLKPGGLYMDCTFGGGGHTGAILTSLEGDCTIIAIDQDPEAIANGKERFKDSLGNVIFVNDNFKNIKEILKALGINQLDGIIFDLGVSSYQLDNKSRGFSYQENAPLDMRMNPNWGPTAKDIVNNYSQEELSRIIFKYGEEKWASRISSKIVSYRTSKPIETTGELVEIIKNAIPAAARREGPHPAKRTFQAIRIEVNKELTILESAIKDAVAFLNPGGRICVITFHSLEDRIIKNVFKEMAEGCECPSDFPLCVCDKKPVIKIINKKPILPSQKELKENPRSRSAKLRVGKKLPV